MNTFPIGSTVYVRWYGKVLQGEIIPNKDDNPIFRNMVHVLAPVQGVKVITVFSPSHVYTSPKDIPGAPSLTKEDAHIPTEFPTAVNHPDIGPSCGEFVSLTLAKQRYINFKASNWDAANNRLCVDVLDEFYTLWRTCIALKRGLPTAKQSAAAISIDPATPGGDRSTIVIIDTHTNKVVSPSSVGLDSIETTFKRKKTTPIQLSLNF